MDYKIVFGILAILVGLSGYIFYFKDIFLRKTKPHAFSWLVWLVLAAISFAGQVVEGAGSGAWFNGVSIFLCLIIFLFALKYGEKNIVFMDWLSLLCAGISLLFWYFTKAPLFTMILITGIDFFGFLPTIRKSYQKPHQETAKLYFASGLAHVFSLFAMEQYSVTTSLYSSFLVVINCLFVLMLLWRRKVQV